MSTFGDIVSGIDNLSAQAAAWYSQISARPVIAPGSAQLVAGQYAAITAGQQAQANQALVSQYPVTASILGSPTTLLLLGLGLIVLLFLILRK